MTIRRTMCGQYRLYRESNRVTFYNTMLSRMSYIKAGRMDDPETGESLNTWGIAA